MLEKHGIKISRSLIAANHPQRPFIFFLTPGLGRRIPELAEGGELFEIHYSNNYDR
jgi:hypothetical protein